MRLIMQGFAYARYGLGLAAKEGGAPGKIRTPDPQIRSLVLYPAELPVPGRRAWPRRRAGFNPNPAINASGGGALLFHWV